MPVRKVSNCSGNITGSFPSQIKGEKVKYESTIERDLVYFFKFDPTVITYRAQPMTITGTATDGVIHTYTPDFLVARTNGKEIIECKPEVLLNSSHAQQQIAIGQEWAANNDHDFAIVTDTNLRAGHTLENLKLLWRYSRQTVPTATLARCIKYIEKHPEGVSFQCLTLYLSTLATQAAQQAFMQAPLIYNMLFRHILSVELTVPFTSTTLLKRCQTPTAAPLTYIRPE
jgi:TnsA endonuclease-like protein